MRSAELQVAAKEKEQEHDEECERGRTIEPDVRSSSPEIVATGGSGSFQSSIREASTALQPTQEEIPLLTQMLPASSSEPRINLILRGRSSGDIRVAAKHKQKLGLLLKHFASKTAVVGDGWKALRIEFEGERLDPESTVGALVEEGGLEDDDILEVHG